jgi:hypothetical protein
MSRWFRWYEGTTEDAKFRLVARLSRVTIRDVIALWAFILEDAAHLDHRGVCRRNEDFMAATLDFEDGVVERILEAMENADMISVGHGAITVCNFGKRQFESDADPTANDRQKRKRERDKQASNAHVTRDSRPPETETYTEKKEAEAIASDAAAPPVYTDSKHELWGEGIAILGALGVPDRKARPIIGRWLRDAKDDAQAVLGAIQRARDNRVIDPVPWITRAIGAGHAATQNRSPIAGWQASRDAGRDAYAELKAFNAQHEGREDDGAVVELLPAARRG